MPAWVVGHRFRRPRCGVAVPLSGGRRLEPQGGGWDVVEVESAEIAADLVQRARLGATGDLAALAPSGPPATDPPATTTSNAMRGATLESRLEEMGCAQILFQAKAQRQPSPEPVPNGQVPARLPQPAICQQRRGVRVGGGICGLVQPPAPPQRHQIRDAPSAAQRCREGNLPTASRGLREGTSLPSKTLEPKHPLLASTRRSVDQQATRRRARTDHGATLDSGHPSGRQGGHLPESHRGS